MLLKQIVEGVAGAGLSNPKILVAASAKGDISVVKDLVAKHSDWVRCGLLC